MASEGTSGAGEGFTIRDRRGKHSEPAEPPRAGSSPGAEKPSWSPESGEAARSGPVGLPVEPDLASLFLLLANSALLHLGEGAEGMTGGRPVDLGQAQFSINLLRLLKEKTEGNRTPEETRLLEGILYDLEMRFVEIARRG